MMCDMEQLSQEATEAAGVLAGMGNHESWVTLVKTIPSNEIQTDIIIMKKTKQQHKKKNFMVNFWNKSETAAPDSAR